MELGLGKGGTGHGEFLKMVEEELPFRTRMAQLLMSVSGHPVISNSHHGANLPSSWRTLAVLAQLSESQFLKQLKAGSIHPGSERKGQLLPWRVGRV